MRNGHSLLRLLAIIDELNLPEPYRQMGVGSASVRFSVMVNLLAAIII